MFWLIAAGLCVLASTFVALPLLRGRSPSSPAPSQGQINKRVIREQLQEIDADFVSGKIDSQQLQRLKDELYATALGDDALLSASVKPSAATLARPKSTLVVFTVGLSLTTLLLYQYLGYLEDLRISQSLQQTQTRELSPERLKTLIPALERRSQRRPENSSYRFLLAQAQMQAQRYAEATASYKKLVEQFENDAQLWAYYAQALYIGDGRRMSKAAQDALQRALQLNPRQSTALGLQGMHAFEQQDYATAIKAWSGLLAGLPPGSPQANTINSALQRARGLAPTGAATQPQAKVEADASEASIKVKVAADIGTQLPKDTTVFVYARAAKGPKMPLAIKRLQLGDLPADVELDDSMAMSPAMRLSTIDTVQVIARISMSGQATAQSGDWEASSTPLKTQKQADAIELIIREQIK
ncbi:MAG: c-type cytochrome biogenesis protein CcmI [Pseudomonadales bacterium]